MPLPDDFGAISGEFFRVLTIYVFDVNTPFLIRVCVGFVFSNCDPRESA